MKKILITQIVLATVLVIGGIVGISITAQKASACGFFTPCDSDATYQQQNEQGVVASQVKKLSDASPIPQLEHSLERDNISRRLTTFSKSDKISYIYLVSFGKVMSFYTVKGKITSGSKRLTSQEKFVNPDEDYNGNAFSTEAPELDGTYGRSADYIYFWTTDGVYVQWNGEYMLADQPLQLTTQPELVRTIK